MKQQSVIKQWVYRVLCVFMGAMLMVGCKSPNHPGIKYEMVQTQAIAHTQYRVTQFYVNDYWGGSAGAYGTGGGGVCCVPIPPKWHDGLTAKVRWTYSQAIKDVRGNPIGETVWYEYDAPILPFQQLDAAVIHFFPDGTAKIVILSPENIANYPIPKSVPPKGWEYPDANEEYCSVVDLKGLSKSQCVARLKEKFGY